MGDIGEVTASSLSAHQDVIDMEAEGKRGITDYTSLEADLDKWKTKALDVINLYLYFFSYMTDRI
jgi:hypothetical protein